MVSVERNNSRFVLPARLCLNDMDATLQRVRVLLLLTLAVAPRSAAGVAVRANGYGYGQGAGLPAAESLPLALEATGFPVGAAALGVLRGRLHRGRAGRERDV